MHILDMDTIKRMGMLWGQGPRIEGLVLIIRYGWIRGEWGGLVDCWGQAPRLEGSAQCTQSANTSQHDRWAGRGEGGRNGRKQTVWFGVRYCWFSFSRQLPHKILRNCPDQLLSNCLFCSLFLYRLYCFAFSCSVLHHILLSLIVFLFPCPILNKGN